MNMLASATGNNSPRIAASQGRPGDTGRLETRLRRASSMEELRYCLVNEGRDELAIDCILLHECSRFAKPAGVPVVTGLAQASADSPLLIWLGETIASALAVRKQPRETGQSPHLLHDGLHVHMLERHTSGDSTFPYRYAASCHLLGPDAKPVAIATLLSARPFAATTLAAADRVMETASLAWQRHGEGSLFGRSSPGRLLRANAGRLLLACGLLLAAAMFIPVPLGVMGAARIVADNPLVVTAPTNGVVERVHVPPDTPVRSGDLLVTLDDTELRNAHELAIRNAVLALARLQGATRDAFTSESARREVAILTVEHEIAIAERDHAAERLAATRIRAERAGVAVHDGTEQWSGRPVTTGERIMRIAEPRSTRLRIELSGADATGFGKGALVRFHPEADPLASIEARVESWAYEAEQAADGSLVFPVTARLIPPDTSPGETVGNAAGAQRIGMSGTARISGRAIPLWLYLFRRPLSALRQFTGIG